MCRYEPRTAVLNRVYTRDRREVAMLPGVIEIYEGIHRISVRGAEVDTCRRSRVPLMPPIYTDFSDGKKSVTISSDKSRKETFTCYGEK